MGNIKKERKNLGNFRKERKKNRMGNIKKERKKEGWMPYQEKVK